MHSNTRNAFAVLMAIILILAMLAVIQHIFQRNAELSNAEAARKLRSSAYAWSELIRSNSFKSISYTATDIIAGVAVKFTSSPFYSVQTKKLYENLTAIYSFPNGSLSEPVSSSYVHEGGLASALMVADSLSSADIIYLSDVRSSRDGTICYSFSWLPSKASGIACFSASSYLELLRIVTASQVLEFEFRYV